MLNKEILHKLNEAIGAIHEFKRKPKLGTAAEEEIEKTASILLKEAFVLGPAGKQCPLCGGSGRVS